jgi:DNA-binding NarL/FixJ family response regulator
VVEAGISMSNAASKFSPVSLAERHSKDFERHTSTASTDPPLTAPTKNFIVVIDAHLFSRECLLRVLGEECSGRVASFSTVDQWVNSPQLGSTSVVVLCQYGRSPADAMREVERLCEFSAQTGDCPVVVLSNNEDPDLIVKMLGKSVRGYIPTSLSVAIVVQAIELARAGGVYVPASSLIAAHRPPEEPLAPAQKVNNLFTARQAAVVDALRRGKANKIIAYELKMRESTVKVHVRNIMKKLHATNRTEVAYMATRILNGEELGG